MMMPSVNHDDFAHLRIPIEEVLSATNNFDDKNVIGKGYFEITYRGVLLWSGDSIDIAAVRWLNKDRLEEVEQLFWMEISMLSSLKHKNMVSLVGFCDDNDEKIIVIKLETRGHLSNYLSDPKLLTCVRRLEISVGLARALGYIHYDESRDFSVIHRGITSATVLLNADWEPKLCYFLCSMKMKASERHNSFHNDKLNYINGYGDPVYIQTKKVSHKLDIYLFGILLFELLCGRRSGKETNKYLAPVAITHYREKKLHEIIDWDLWKQMDSQSLEIFAETAYACLNEERSQRPNIDEIVTRLEKALELHLEHLKVINLPDHTYMMSSVNHEDFAHLKIPLESILSATNNFDDKNVIEKGYFGKVYRGQLLWSGELIDIDAWRWNKDKWDDKDEQGYWMEISMLSSLKHKNVVSLVGFCDENDEKIIIVRRNIRGSLSNYLSDPMLLTWVRRLEISVGLARALGFIHYDESHYFTVIHRCINSRAVLLNDDWEPKLYGFHYSMKMKASERHNSFYNDKVHYINGYGDPVYIDTKKVNHKSDIYSFGIVLFELLCGRRSGNVPNKYLAPVAITHYREKKLHEIIDWDLWKQMDSQSLEIFAKTAYDCLNEERSQWPNIDEIVTRLEKALELQLEHQKVTTSLSSNEFAHLKVPLQIIISATNNFAQENVILINDGAKEYKGQLLWSGKLIDIAARRFNKERNDRGQRFWMAISMLSTLKHKNLVSLFGFCDENDEKIVIYKRATRGILINYLSDPMLLTWVRRLEICVGLAYALRYIHYDEPRDYSVIHRHIDSSRVLLNDYWEPKLCDFECSMKIEASQRHHSFHTNKLEYIIGYGDPTYIQTKSVNHKSDMYSFGIVMFELLCGPKSVDKNDKYLASLAITHYKEKILLYDIIDPDLWKQMDQRSFNIFVETLHDCLNSDRSQRPNIDEIVPRLEKALDIQLKPENYDNSIGEGTSPFIHKKFQHLKIELRAIKSATNGFNDSHCIGKGGFGKVYKGELVHSKGQSIVAIKRLDRALGQGDPEFWKEITMLSLYRHDNIVSLLGFCDDCGEKILVYDYASKKSLDLYLNDKVLTWVQRLEICIGAARGLAYLHCKSVGT